MSNTSFTDMNTMTYHSQEEIFPIDLGSHSLIDRNSSIMANSSNSSTSVNRTEEGDAELFHSTILNMALSMPEWEAIITIVSMGMVIITTIIGTNG